MIRRYDTKVKVRHEGKSYYMSVLTLNFTVIQRPQEIGGIPCCCAPVTTAIDFNHKYDM